MKKKLLIASLCAALLVNTSVMPVVGINTVAAKSATVTQEAYNPFADDEEKTENLTMAEKVAKMQKEANETGIEGVAKGHVYIPKGTKLEVELVKEMNSKTAKEGQDVDIRLVNNLIVNGVVVIPKGTLGKAYVYKARSAGGLGRSGELQIAGREFTTINGVKVPLKQGIGGKGKTDGGAAAVAVAVSLVGGLFMKGTNVDYPANTSFEVEVRSNVDLEATPNNLADVMNPDIVRGNSIQVNVY